MVIATIALLASIVLVALKGGREKAQIAKTLQWSRSVKAQLGGDMVGSWNFNEGGGTTAYDAAGYNNGTLMNGVSWTDGVRGLTGKALSFDGVDDYVDAGNASSLNITGAITVEAWVKLNALSHQYVLGKTNAAATENGYGIALDPNGKFEIIIWGGAGVAIKNAPGGIIPQTGVWYHVVGLSDGTNVRTYVNGQLDRSASGGMPSNIGTSPLFIGKIAAGYITNGTIDEVRIYNRALTAMEIQKHYAEGAEKHQFAEK